MKHQLTRYALQQLVTASKEYCPWLPGLAKAISKAELLPANASLEDLENTLLQLFEEIPLQPENADWWSDELGRAYKNAETLLDQIENTVR